MTQKLDFGDTVNVALLRLRTRDRVQTASR